MLELLGLSRRRRRRAGAVGLLVAGALGVHYGGPTATAQLTAIEQRVVAEAVRTFTQSLPATTAPGTSTPQATSHLRHRPDHPDQRDHR